LGKNQNVKNKQQSRLQPISSSNISSAVAIFTTTSTKANYLLKSCQQQCSLSKLNTNGFAGGFIWCFADLL